MTTNNVTWKWLVGILVLIVLGGGGAWMTTMYAEVGRVKEEQKIDRQTINDVKAKVGVIDEQTKRTQQDIEEIKKNQERANDKLNELLRRVR